MGMKEWRAKYANHPKSYKKICVTCGKEFEAYRKDRKYCSIRCQGLARQLNFNLTSEEWDMLREFILERDNYTCQDCGRFAMDIGLEAHHIKPLFRRGTNDEKNLITLCHKCHKHKHHLGRE